ncbi:NAD-dependent protein deacylase [Wohlfahrtiimonas larvae]|uniref:NAD-dependent protein deacylase n=2 Tax=Wohlfahrtiimonas larvae TaxID=1157986 RepID=A0ABP9ML59_9GAMM
MSILPCVVILTGAGISAESGIRTFRASDGLWEEHRIEDVATPEGFLANPKLVQRFYNERRQHLKHPSVQPNPAHFALADLEKSLGQNFLLVTQNVDNLHERAGSQSLIHMHGELLKVRCTTTDQIYDWHADVTENSLCECCQTATLRPHIVWFGEMPLAMDYIYDQLAQADFFISIGTSGNVYPAAGFMSYAKSHGAHTVELNLDPTLGTSQFDESHQGLASKIVPKYVELFLQNLRQ